VRRAYGYGKCPNQCVAAKGHLAVEHRVCFRHNQIRGLRVRARHCNAAVAAWAAGEQEALDPTPLGPDQVTPILDPALVGQTGGQSGQ
jgi:hypothetical protein